MRSRATAAGRNAGLVVGIGASLMLSVVPAGAQPPCDPCVIGVVFDGPWDRNSELRAHFEREIRALVSPRYTAAFPPDKTRIADWTFDAAREAVEELLADPEVAVVLTAGPVASSHLVRRGELPKPVVAAFVLDPGVQGFPIETTDAGERVSGIRNLSYLTFSGDPAAEFGRFQEIAPFDHVAYLMNDAQLAANPALGANLRRAGDALGFALEVVGVGTSPEAAVATISSAADAAYVAPLPQLSAAGFDRLVTALIERRLPAFSWWGRSEVERGLLASVYLDADFLRLARRVALHVGRVLHGEDAGALPVDFRRSQRLTLNLDTARRIGVHPPWSVLTEAEVFGSERADPVRRLDLAAAAREAVAANLDLAASGETVSAGQEAVRAAWAALLPQVSASGLGEIVDRRRSEGAFAVQPRWLYGGSIRFTQVLYSDAAWANARIQGRLQESRAEAHEELRLDIAHQGAISYLGVLRAEAFERVQRENLAAIRSNLELAQARRRAGVARASEVIRWENEIAGNRREVIEAGVRRRVAEIELNRLLNRPLEEPFATSEIAPADPSLLVNAAAIERYAGNQRAFDILRDFMSREGLAGSPELRQLDAAVAARERKVQSARRAFWAPSIAARGDLTAHETADLGLDSFGAPPPALNWTLGLSVSLPLFEGGARFAEVSRAEHERNNLLLARRGVAERIEQRVRTAMHFARASYAGIDLAAEAADAARRNLELVTDAYEQGAVAILDLLDAQRAALVAEETVVSAFYDYLSDVMDLHRAIGRFGFFMNSAEIGGFGERLRAFFQQADPP